MKKQEFNKIINNFYMILNDLDIQENSEGKRAAIDRVRSLLQSKKEMFEETFEEPNQENFNYFMYDLFLHIEEDINDFEIKTNKNIFSSEFLKLEKHLLSKFKETTKHFYKSL